MKQLLYLWQLMTFFLLSHVLLLFSFNVCWTCLLWVTRVFFIRKALCRAVLKAVAVPSDFVTNSYGQSWDSSCKTSWVPVHNQWVPVQKKQGVINWKCLGLICNQTVNRETDAKTPYYSLLIIKKQSFYILKAQKLLNYFCIFKQQPQKSHKRDILP